MTDQLQSFDPFAKELAYVRVNERLIDRTLRRLKGCQQVAMLDVAAGTGLMTGLAHERARQLGIQLQSTLIDLDGPALQIARQEVGETGAHYVIADAAHLPFVHQFDVAVFANSLHLLDDDAKRAALQGVHQVLRPGAVLAVNTTFYDGAYPEESKPFYSRWIRRAVAEMNRRVPNRSKGERAQAMESLPAEGYRQLVECAGFEIAEMRERRVLLSQSAVRAICGYKNFAMGALHATDEDAEQASQALQVTVRQTFRDLKMHYLPRNWLEIIAVRA
ncbi:MAG TPA: methyltransferase domain-containing protein [Dehalococcoidia bacterium]|nr:methyltransferase domain-containing protein [Dehalococcoidia bacterium]